MRTSLLTILLAWLLAFPACQEAVAQKAQITGPAQVAAGRFGRYTTEDSTGKTLRWLILPEYAEPWFLPVIIDSGDGTGIRGGLLMPESNSPVYITLIAVEGDKVDIKTLAVNSGGIPPAPPGPGPGPQPPGPTPPPQPPSNDETVKAWWDWTFKTVPSNVNIPQDKLKDQAHRLGAAMTDAVASVESQKASLTARQAREIMAKRTYDAFTAEERGVWKAWSVAMDAEVRKLTDSGKLTQVQSFILIWTGVSKALSAM